MSGTWGMGEGKAWEVAVPGLARGWGAQWRVVRSSCGVGGVRDLRASWASPRLDDLAAGCSSMLQVDGEGSASPLERGIIKTWGCNLFALESSCFLWGYKG